MLKIIYKNDAIEKMRVWAAFLFQKGEMSINDKSSFDHLSTAWTNENVEKKKSQNHPARLEMKHWKSCGAI